ncbi:hypothetical protein AWB92_03865 [Mycobacterium sp. IEC1808]|nr:hypothetical protein AWB92_03865 [Mycobacterium sp. IEC1808]
MADRFTTRWAGGSAALAHAVLDQPRYPRADPEVVLKLWDKSRSVRLAAHSAPNVRLAAHSAQAWL